MDILLKGCEYANLLPLVLFTFDFTCMCMWQNKVSISNLFAGLFMRRRFEDGHSNIRKSSYSYATWNNDIAKC